MVICELYRMFTLIKKACLFFLWKRTSILPFHSLTYLHLNRIIHLYIFVERHYIILLPVHVNSPRLMSCFQGRDAFQKSLILLKENLSSVCMFDKLTCEAWDEMFRNLDAMELIDVMSHLFFLTRWLNCDTDTKCTICFCIAFN